MKLLIFFLLLSLIFRYFFPYNDLANWYDSLYCNRVVNENKEKKVAEANEQVKIAYNKLEEDRMLKYIDEADQSLINFLYKTMTIYSEENKNSTRSNAFYDIYAILKAKKTSE